MGKKQFDLLRLLEMCDGYYKSPEDNGRILGPLVAYAGTYQTEEGPKNYVGAEYFNFARAETHPPVRQAFAETISSAIEVSILEPVDVVLGAPMGGIMLATAVGDVLGIETIFAEKIVTALADKKKGTKEESHLVINRHDLFPGKNVVIIEDVCNNFSTTEKLKTLIAENLCNLVGIACAFNRSNKIEWEGIPVASGLFIPTKQYRQDDPEIAGLVASGNIVWKPEAEWFRLKQAMKH